MRTPTRLGLGILGIVAIGTAIFLAGRGTAADDKNLAGTIDKLAAALEKKNDADAKKLCASAKDTELSDLMALFKLRSRKGLGVGTKDKPVTPDGIEARFVSLGARPTTPAVLAAQADALAQAALRTAAIAEVAAAKCPVDKKEGEKDPKKWKEWSEEMKTASLELAAAAKAKNAAGVRTAANKVNASCNNCHGVFRD